MNFFYGQKNWERNHIFTQSRMCVESKMEWRNVHIFIAFDEGK